MTYDNQIVYTHCLHPGCNARLHLPEEWAVGVCTLHADPDTSPPPSPEINWDERLAWIDALLDEAPTGVIPRPNRRA